MLRRLKIMKMKGNLDWRIGLLTVLGIIVAGLFIFSLSELNLYGIIIAVVLFAIIIYTQHRIEK